MIQSTKNPLRPTDPQRPTEGGIAVLGAGGFLGSHLTNALLDQTDADLLAVDRNLERLPHHPRLVQLKSAIQDEEVLERIAQCDVVFSLTAICNPARYNTAPIEVIHENFTHLLPVIECCKENNIWLIQFSTCEVYGKATPIDSDTSMQEDQTPMVLGPVSKERWTYANAKQLLERVVWAEGKHHGLRFTIIRPFNIVGPGMDFLQGIDGEGTPRVLACFMKAIVDHTPLPLVDGGQHRRAFMGVDDFKNAMLAILTHPDRCAGEVINVGNPNNEMSIKELAHMVDRIQQNAYGKSKLGTQDVAAGEFYGEGYDDIERRIPSIEKIQLLTGFTPQQSLESILPGIIGWYLSRYQPKDEST